MTERIAAARAMPGPALRLPLLFVGATVVALGVLEGFLVALAEPVPLWPSLLYIPAAWIYTGAGLVAWSRRPANTLGALMVAAGLAWLAANLFNTEVVVLEALGAVLATLPLALVVHLTLALPSGRVGSGLPRVVLVASYLVSLVLQMPLYLFDTRFPAEILVLADRPDLARLGQTVQTVAGATVVVATGALLARRLWSATPAHRRALAPLYAYGVIGVLSIPVTARLIAPTLQLPLGLLATVQVSILAGIPVAFVIGVLRGGFARTGDLSELAALLAQGDDTRPPLGDAVGRTLGDPSLQLVYSVAGSNGYVNATGAPVDEGVGRGEVEVDVHDRRVGAILYDTDLIADAELVRSVGRVVALAMDRERLTVELRASEDELRRSRARVVEAADRERRRLAGDLHDGLQVRLVLLGIEAEELAADAGSAAGSARATALREHIDQAAAELRQLVRAVLPAALVERGLSGATEDLVDRMPLPTRLDVTGLDRTLPSVVESTAYFVVAEALTNALKHGGAGAIAVRLACDRERLLVEVSDDGVGGARAEGNGLRGLADRVDVLGGRFRLDSPHGAGTRLRAELPCGS